MHKQFSIRYRVPLVITRKTELNAESFRLDGDLKSASCFSN